MNEQAKPETNQTTFFTLPRELRQQILEAEFEETCTADLHLRFHGKPYHFTDDWAADLSSVHEIIAQDMIMVVQKWKRWSQKNWPAVYTVKSAARHKLLVARHRRGVCGVLWYIHLYFSLPLGCPFLILILQWILLKKHGALFRQY